MRWLRRWNRWVPLRCHVLRGNSNRGFRRTGRSGVQSRVCIWLCCVSKKRNGKEGEEVIQSLSLLLGVGAPHARVERERARRV